MAEVAEHVWGDRELAANLRAAAGSLQSRFDEAFWIEERQVYALALDRDKQRVDSLCSNLGHLLWSGIVPEGKVGQIAAALSGPELWTGWGVRTMGSCEAAYNPLSYHNGTVWPHDTALAAWGLARAGFHDLAQVFGRSLIEAATTLDYSLPEVFAGYARSETAFPVAYPTAAKPQAWAAGAPVLCITLLLGLSPDPLTGRLATSTPDSGPDWLEGTVLEGVRAHNHSWRIEIKNGAIAVDET
jgi:glycogen debranching enzyme